MSEIRQIELPTPGLEELRSEALAEGHDFIEKLVDDWASGQNRFDVPGEVFYGCMDRGSLVAVGGLNRDPFAACADVGRIRRVYVRAAWRNQGIATALVTALVEHARQSFRTVRLRAVSPNAARLYERMGFSPNPTAHATHILTFDTAVLTPAVEADYDAIVDLANLAYRGTGGDTGGGIGAVSWNVETGILEGTRLTESLLREEIAAKPTGFLLTLKDEQTSTLLGTVRLDPKESCVWHLGLLAVRPDMQAKQLGRAILAAAEGFAKQRGARRIHMTVLHVRAPLIAWYQRRGYRLTGETEPFPYGDERFGRPLRDDLCFVVLEKDIAERELNIDVRHAT